MKNKFLKIICVCLILINLFSLCACKKNDTVSLPEETEIYSEVISEKNPLQDVPVLEIYTEESENAYSLIITYTINNKEEWKIVKKNILTNENSLSYKLIAQHEDIYIIWANGKMFALNNKGEELWETVSTVINPEAAVCDNENIYLIYTEDPASLSRYKFKTGKFEEIKELNIINIFTATLKATKNENTIFIQDVYNNNYKIDLNTYTVDEVIEGLPLSFSFPDKADKETVINENINENAIMQYKFGNYEIITIISPPGNSIFENKLLDEFNVAEPVNISGFDFKQMTNITKNNNQEYRISYLSAFIENYNYSIIINCSNSDYSESAFNALMSTIQLK